MTKPDFDTVIRAWDDNARAGARAIHPLKPDTDAYWELGREQARQVDDYAQPGDFVIDFGCGIGRLAIPLAKACYNVLAVDASPAMLEGLAERATDVEIGMYRSDGTDLGELVDHVIGEKADVIVARNVLIHHDYAGVERIVTGLASALRPGGHLIADWPLGPAHERQNWTGVTTWPAPRRLAVADRAGLDLVDGASPSVWRKKGTPDV